MKYIAVLIITLFVLHLLHTDSSEQRLVRYSMNTTADSTVIQQWLQVLSSHGVKFPMVALAQATWETNYFKSRICKENKNLFGMRFNSRGFALKPNLGHAYYDNVAQSVRDYAAWQHRMLQLRPDINTEDEYIQMLDSLPIGKGLRYAEDTTYTQKIRLRINELHKIDR